MSLCFFALGPLQCNCYGLAIVAGLLAFIVTMLQNPRATTIITKNQLLDLVAAATLVGIIGGRLLYILLHPQEFKSMYDLVAVWEGGLSVLGGFIAIVLVMPWYLHIHKIPIIPMADLAAVHVPLLHSIARLGCLAVGCCAGTVTTARWAITYTDPHSLAPLGLPLHPTQLYSSMSLFLIYLIMRYYLQERLQRPGQLAGCYAIFAGLERGINEWFRDEFAPLPAFTISIQQCIALSLIIIGIGILFWATIRPTQQS